MREIHPEGKIVVHPECLEEVVLAADANGSTGFIVSFVEKAQAASTIIIGTELNLVYRLGLMHPDKKVLPLARSLCPNMYRINLNNLLYTLDNLENDANRVIVPEDIKSDARAALERMLSLTACSSQ
jgi:quinolinate synthase